MRMMGQCGGSAQARGSVSPTLLLRISDGSYHMHRSFCDFGQAVKSAEAFAGAGFTVSLMSATGKFLMGFEARREGKASAAKRENSGFRGV